LESLLVRLSLARPAYAFDDKTLGKILAHCCDKWESEEIVPVYEWCVSDGVIASVMKELEIPKKRLSKPEMDNMRAMLEKERKARMTRYVQPVSLDSLSDENRNLLLIAWEAQQLFL
jgi:hypothetical protein